MKYVFVLIFILSGFYCRADCDAPALSLEVHKKEVYGFEILKLLGNENDPKMSSGDTKIPFGDYEFLFKATRENLPKPKEVRVGKEDALKKILKAFKSSPHYLGKEKQQFSVTNMQGIDLQGKGNADIILFEVSPGANSYSGAIGIINGKWFAIIPPRCY